MSEDSEPRLGGVAPPAHPEIYRARRERLLARVGDGVVVVPAAPELRRARDAEVRYRQAADFYYLTGFGEPGAVAVLTPHDAEHRFTLFLRPRDGEREAWTGVRLGVERAMEVLGASAAYPIEELGARLPDLLRPASRIHCPLGASAELDARVMEILVAARRPRARSGVGPTGVEELDVLLGPMRRVKEPLELERIRTAAAIAARGHLAAMGAAAEGLGEWELQAVLEGTFRSLGATGPAFPSIVAAGANATVLHYVANDARIAAGRLVLIDAGAEWGMYCSDITRTFPPSGRFTPQQRELYEIVLAARDAGIAAIAPGATVAGVHEAAVRVLLEGLLAVGILPPGDPEELIAEGAHKPYYMHQTSHWLGLDVHDTGLYREGGSSVVFEPGMVLTVEPGLYLPATADDLPEALRGIGIRIEDDVLVTGSGHEVLTREVPSSPEEVEAVVRAGR